MKISIITNVLNAVDTVGETISCVLNQTYTDIEYIIIDGESKDGTLDIINRHRGDISVVVSEPDKSLYNAMNKGLKLATGDVVGFLHADDVFMDDAVICKVVNAFKDKKVDCLWGDLFYVDKINMDKTIRYWKSCEYSNNLFKMGWMPAHPTFFVKRDVYEKYGYFNEDLEISADYELMLRFIHKHKVSSCYLPETLVKMRMGGLSNRSIKNLIKKSSEDVKAWKINELGKGFLPVFLKNISKVPQFFIKGKKYGKDKSN